MMRRATPDSEAVASSEDEKPWPTATTFGSLPRKENGVPGLGGGIWATQSRGSFKLSDQARRIAAHEARLSAPNPTHPSVRSANTPSPAASSEGTNALPFAIPLQPTPKAGRSLSHSQGQREILFSSGPSAQSQQSVAGLVPMGLLNEAEEVDVDTEDEYEYGGPLAQTSSHPPLAALQRTVTMPSQYESYGYSNRADRRAETMDEAMFKQKLDRRFEDAFGGLTLDQPTRKPQWQTSLGWEELPNINESRRHSLADIPTRRGSLVGIYDDPRIAAYNDNINLHLPISSHSDLNSNNSRLSESFNIPEGYRVPYVALEPHERADTRNMLVNMSANTRPRKMLYVVSFKCSRVGVFYLLDNTGLVVNEGDMVIVEADRGQDLGTVQHARVTQEEAKTLLAKYGEEQYKWLMMFSRNNQAGAVNPNAAVYGELASSDMRVGNVTNTSNALSTRPPRDQFQNLKPKAIKRMAAPHEINMLKEKEGNEAKAKRACQQKVYQHHLDMEILEAEFQWDWQKLIFYYYADHYVNFKDLVNDLYKCYKVRLWMSAVNPASFSHNAVGQPPTGIGPGAVSSPNSSEFDQSYTMQHGTDPDPYGAIPTYRVFDIYNASLPGPPGVPNDYSKQPAAAQQVAGGGVQEQYGGAPTNGFAANSQQYGNITNNGQQLGGGINYAQQWENQMYGSVGSGLGAHTMHDGTGIAQPWRGIPHAHQHPAQHATQQAIRNAGGITTGFVGMLTATHHPGNAAYQQQQLQTNGQQQNSGATARGFNNTIQGFAPRGTPDNRWDRYDQEYR